MAVAVAALVLMATFVYLDSDEQQPYDGNDYQVPVDGGTDMTLAPDFSLPVVDDGGILQLSSLRGRVVVLDFMATWCAPCATQMIELENVQDAYSPSQVVILSIDVDDRESESLISNYKIQKDITWDVLRDGGSVGSLPVYNAKTIPTIVIVDQTGHITYRNVGVTQDTVLMEEIDKLLP